MLNVLRVEALEIDFVTLQMGPNLIYSVRGHLDPNDRLIPSRSVFFFTCPIELREETCPVGLYQLVDADDNIS